MDSGTAIVGAISAVICASPFVLTGINRRKKEKNLLAVLKDFAIKNDSEITQYEICGNYAIGLNDTEKTLSFVSKIEDDYKTQFIDLSAVIDCKSANIYRSSKGGKVIQRLCLQLSYAEPLKQEDVLEFYNADVCYQLSGEIESMEKWHKTISNLLNK